MKVWTSFWYFGMIIKPENLDNLVLNSQKVKWFNHYIEYSSGLNNKMVKIHCAFSAICSTRYIKIKQTLDYSFRNIWSAFSAHNIAYEIGNLNFVSKLQFPFFTLSIHMCVCVFLSIGTKLSEDSRKYGAENACTSGSSLSKATMSYCGARMDIEREHEILLKALGTQISSLMYYIKKSFFLFVYITGKMKSLWCWRKRFWRRG